MGPHESYWDHKSDTWGSKFEGTVTEQCVPYIMPQEHGNKTDLRWLALDDGKDRTAQDLFKAKHTKDLTPRAETILTIDHHQRGQGTTSCGPDA